MGQKPQQKTPLFVGYCGYQDCPFCAQDFFAWYAERMNKQELPLEETKPKFDKAGNMVRRGRPAETTSFNEAAATSVKPPR